MLAAACGRLEVLQWAREHHCPWGDACAFADEGGHIEALQWLREHHCPWNADACARVADGRGHAEVAQWVRAQTAL